MQINLISKKIYGRAFNCHYNKSVRKSFFKTCPPYNFPYNDKVNIENLKNISIKHCVSRKKMFQKVSDSLLSNKVMGAMEIFHSIV